MIMNSTIIQMYKQVEIPEYYTNHFAQYYSYVCITSPLIISAMTCCQAISHGEKRDIEP